MAEMWREIDGSTRNGGRSTLTFEMVARSSAMNFHAKQQRRSRRCRTLTDAELDEITDSVSRDASLSALEASEQRTHFYSVLQSLDPVEREICKLFQEGLKKAAICRMSNLKRWTFEKHCRNIKKAFQNAGLALERG